MKTWWIARIVKGAAFVAAVAGLFGLAVMLLWNWLIPDIFRGPEVTYGQAVGLLLLSHILVRGWNGGHGGWRSHRWKHKMEEKLAAMTPEERERFKEEWRKRCGSYPGDEKTPS